MPEYIEEEKTVSVPPTTGVDGFLETIKGILSLSRVQRVVIDQRGTIQYKRFRRQGEPEKELEIDLDTLLPSAIVRSRHVEELILKADNAAVAVCQMFVQASMDGYNPVAFVGGRASKFPEWHTRTTEVVLRREEAYGLPFYKDQNIPDESFLLCVAHGRRAAMVDVVRSYKITIPMSPR